MEARTASKLPEDPGWQFEPKWDGFRCLAFRAGDEVEIRAKSGKSLSRFFPEVVANLRSLSAEHVRARRRARHPHRRNPVLRRPADAPASRGEPHRAAGRERRQRSLILFDCLLTKAGQPLLARPFEERRAALEALFAKAETRTAVAHAVHPRPRKAEAWLAGRHVQIDGVMAKRLDLPYLPGERAMLKVKHLRTADCVVGGFRYESGSRRVGSLLLGLYDEERPAPSCRLHLAIAEREAGADGAAGKADRAAGLHRQRTGRSEPLEHGEVSGMAAAAAGAGRGGALRPRHRRPFPPRHQARALAAGQGARAVHVRAVAARPEAAPAGLP